MEQIPARFLTIENIDLVCTCLRMGYRLPASASPDVAVLMDFVQETGLTSFKSWSDFQTETPASECCASECCGDELQRWLVWSVWCWMGHWMNYYPFLGEALGWLRGTTELLAPEYQIQSDHQNNRAIFLMLAITSPHTRQVCHNLSNVAYHEPEMFDLIATRLQFLVRMKHWLPEPPVPELPIQAADGGMAADLDMDGFMDDPDLPEGDITNLLAPEWP